MWTPWQFAYIIIYIISVIALLYWGKSLVKLISIPPEKRFPYQNVDIDILMFLILLALMSTIKSGYLFAMNANYWAWRV